MGLFMVGRISTAIAMVGVFAGAYPIEPPVLETVAAVRGSRLVCAAGERGFLWLSL